MLSISDSQTATLFLKYTLKEVRRHFDVIQRDMLDGLREGRTYNRFMFPKQCPLAHLEKVGVKVVNNACYRKMDYFDY